MTVTDPTLSDGIRIARINGAYRQAKVLHCAVELGLFELLATRPADEDEIVERLGLRPRLARSLLFALVALELLERDGRRYRNSPAVTEFLCPAGEVNLGPAVRVASRRHYRAWADLSDAVRENTGAETVDEGHNAFADLYRNLDDARGFLAHMDSFNGFIGPALVDCLPWRRYRSFVDLGGGRGNIAAQLVRAWPHLAGGVFELPAIRPLFDEYMTQLGVADRVTFHGGDFFVDPVPPADVLLFGHVLHDWSAERCRVLLERAAEALPSGGAVVVYDQMLDEAEPDLHSALASLNVALMTSFGSEYTVEECRGWLEKAGLRVTGGRRLHTVGSDYLLVAEKP
ncbi:methyltransferase [Virgisporangium aurantiacum]|uniref:O-methyltransferase n=1 Tax=Virgisporangium aurantiacum TaxID=175570 RepID=A0A8J3ZCM5_9ACTN|nr:methyltransferase [Virgisporangium aurantiacum]GIJ60378.1 O-methyltransferase [Virgisporangium aurantiacum]